MRAFHSHFRTVIKGFPFSIYSECLYMMTVFQKLGDVQFDDAN